MLLLTIVTALGRCCLAVGAVLSAWTVSMCCRGRKISLAGEKVGGGKTGGKAQVFHLIIRKASEMLYKTAPMAKAK